MVIVNINDTENTNMKERKSMSSGVRLLIKILVFIVSYGVAFALAIFALNQLSGEGTPAFAWIIIAILAICGFRAFRNIPFLSFSGGEAGEALGLTVAFFVLRLLLSIFAGIFIAPWMIARKLTSLIPGGEVEK